MKTKFIKSIIAEEYQTLQEVEYQDEDIIDPTRVDLVSEFNKLNTQLFGDEVPKVPMKWSNRKGNLGHVAARINRLTNDAEIKHLAISSFHAMPYMIFKNTLAHEMIHVLLLSNGRHDPRQPHGYAFHDEGRRINNMGLGYNITTSSEEQLDISDAVKQRAAGKSFICIIIEIDGRKMLNVTTQKVYDAEGENIFDLFQKLVNRGKYREVNIIVVESSNPELLKFRVSRTFKRGLSYAPVEDELLDDLLKGDAIRNEQIRNDISESEHADDAANWIDVTIV